MQVANLAGFFFSSYNVLIFIHKVVYGIDNATLNLFGQVIWLNNFFGLEHGLKLLISLIRQDEVLHNLFEFDFFLVVIFAEKKIISLFEIIH